jgi:hypothetical protein
MRRLNVGKLLCKVSGSRCRYCNITQAADWDSASSLYEEHKSHLDSVRLDSVVVQPPAYAGLRINLELPTFLARETQLSNGFMRLWWTPFKISCRRCNTSTARLSEESVLEFRELHRGHIEEVQIHALTENVRGKAIQHVFRVYGDEGEKLQGRYIGLLSGPGTSRALRNQLMSGEPTEMGCTRCQQSAPFETGLSIEEFMRQHSKHHHRLRLHVLTTSLDECVSLESWIPLTEAADSCSRDRQLDMDCIVFQLTCKDCGASIPAPLSAQDVIRFKQKHGHHLQAIGFQALVRGEKGTTFICTLTESPAPNQYSSPLLGCL